MKNKKDSKRPAIPPVPPTTGSATRYKCCVCDHETTTPRTDMSYAACYRCDDVFCDGPVLPMEALPPSTGSARLLKAAKEADWMQVVYNQGPPCFHLENDRFCLRAERWDGHKTIGGSGAIHEYVSLESLLRSIAPNADKI